VLHYQLTGTPQEPGGNARADFLLNEVLPCRGEDDWLAVSAATPEQLQALAEASGVPELAQRPVDEHALERLRIWTRGQDKTAAMELLVRCGVAAGAVLKIDELMTDRHLTAREFFESVPHKVVGEKPHPRPGFRIRGAPTGTRLAAPLFDGATDEILKTVLGKGASEIATLRRRGAVGGTPAGSLLPS
jgi:crotonobetainyl-CoA:carnitine CoA-transferase CaiB-like acyl-CoA transferase